MKRGSKADRGRKLYRLRYPKNAWMNKVRFFPLPPLRFDAREESLRGYCRNVDAQWEWPSFQRLLKLRDRRWSRK
jgi:hypothetical protein